MSRSRRRPVVRIDPYGRLGNQMFQYMFVLKLADVVPGVDLCGYDMPEWHLSRPAPADFPRGAVWCDQHYIPMRQIARYLRSGLVTHLRVGWLGIRMSNLKDVHEYRKVFTARDVRHVECYGSGHIVVHIRGGDILGNVPGNVPHPDYGPIPLSLMQAAIDASGAHPVFVGELSDDRYTEAIQRRYPDAIYRPSRGALADFETLRRSSELVVAVSTFSWLAAWLGEAEKIHFPVSGIFHPLQLPGYDLLPGDDERYIFYECELRKWTASPADFAYLSAARRHRILRRTEVEQLRDTGRRASRPEDRRRRRTLTRNMYVHLARRGVRKISPSAEQFVERRVREWRGH